MQENLYDKRGVSASKSDVHKAISSMSKGLFPKAFCKILPDFAAGDPDWCNIMHADTAGTKSVLAYLYWRETGDLSIWKDLAIDALVMNLDDLACVGCTDNIIISSTIGRNKKLISGEVLEALISGTQEFLDTMSAFGVNVQHSGGETADVGDVVRTLDVGISAFARIKRSDLIVNDIQTGDVVVGFASYGQPSYINKYNSGIGCNGLTSARHDVLSKYYLENYPESVDPNLSAEVVYCGPHRLTDTVNYSGQDYKVGDLLLSPTLSYLPLLAEILPKYKSQINGIIHNSGGGLTKVLKFIGNKRVVKNNLIAVPPVFELIGSVTDANEMEQHQVFNMGQRLEIYINTEHAAEMIEIAQKFNIHAQVIGHVEDAQQAEVQVITKNGSYLYS